MSKTRKSNDFYLANLSFLFKLLLLTFLIINGVLFSKVEEELKQLTIEQLIEEADIYQHNLVRVRGFLYQDQHHHWILASQPNLKSCCIGNSKKVDQQIFLSSFTPSTSYKYAVTLEGTFYKEPILDKEGKLIQLYHMKNPTLLKNFSFWSWSLGFISISFLTMFLIFCQKKWSFLRQFHILNRNA